MASSHSQGRSHRALARNHSSLRLGVLISGRGSNLEAILESIRRGQLDAQVVVVGCNNAAARGLAVARMAGVAATVVADRMELPKRADRQDRLLEVLLHERVDLVVLAGFDEILGPSLLQAYSGRILNIHPSLLPSFSGGMHAVRDALAHGVKVSGCTVHFVTDAVDEGPIVLQAAVPVEEEDDEARLAARILEQEHRILPLAIQLYAEGRLVVEGRKVRTAGKRIEV